MSHRRERLIERIAAQREALATQAVPLRDATQRLDRGLRAIQYLKRNPLLAVGGGALATILISTYTRTSWLRQGWQVWRLLRQWRR